MRENCAKNEQKTFFIPIPSLPKFEFRVHSLVMYQSLKEARLAIFLYSTYHKLGTLETFIIILMK